MKPLARIALLGLTLTPLLVFADDSFVPLTSVPGLASFASSSSMPEFLNSLYRLCIGAVAVLAVLQITFAGWQFMTSADSITKNQKAKQTIQNAVFGLVLVLSPAIVFGLINPSILDLKFDFSALSTPLSKVEIPGTGTGNETLDKVQEQICKSHTQHAYVTLAPNQTCSAVKGPGWAKTDCCPAGGPAGQTCCSYSPTNSQTPPRTDNTLGKYSFSIAYQDRAYLSDRDSTQKACLAYHDQSFTSEASCQSAYNGVISAAKGNYAVAKSCADTGSHTPTPASSWDRLKSLPACPAE